MMMQIIEVTAVLIGLFIVLKNADSFKTVAGAAGGFYTGVVGALQGPKSSG